MTEALVARLRALPTLSSVPDEQLEWLARTGEVRSAPDGFTFYGNGPDLPGVFIMLSGRFSVRTDLGGTEREVREVLVGEVSGYLPYSRITKPRGYLVADGPVEVLLIPREDIREMTRECHDFTALCVHAMLDRARQFKEDDKRLEKMAALGQLAAGLAHELNNPSSAIARSAGELARDLRGLAAAARALGELELKGPALEAVGRLESAAECSREEPLSAVALADLEDAFDDWLTGRGIEPDLSYALAGTDLTPAALEEASKALDDRQLGVALRYVTAAATAHNLTSDIVSAAERVHSLVSAVKTHTHMDRAQAMEPLLLGRHLADTVALMRSKAAAREVSLELDLAADLHQVQGIVGDLNQAWMQLVDNAIDAAPPSGSVRVEARSLGDRVVVDVVDDGPGVPPELRARIFEPFFTTKEVGRGRGLGLDVVQTVIASHRGTVDLESEPGHTRFRVTLPVAST